MLVHICNCLKRLQDQVKALTSYKIIRLLFQPLAFHYITDRLYVLTYLFSYIYKYIYIYIYKHVYVDIYALNLLIEHSGEH